VVVVHYLDPAIICELHAVVGNELVDLAVLVAFALGVADQDDHLRAFGLVEFRPRLMYDGRTRGLPMMAVDMFNHVASSSM
jgi:hypothetical protein